MKVEMDVNGAPLYEENGLFAVVPTDTKNPNGSMYDLKIFKNKVTFELKKSFLPTYQANKHGLIGLLFNKLFSKFISSEHFEVLVTGITKIEHYSMVDPMGRKINTLMFWKSDPSKADYQNIFFSLSLPEDKIENVKGIFSKMVPDVKITKASK